MNLGHLVIFSEPNDWRFIQSPLKSGEMLKPGVKDNFYKINFKKMILIWEVFNSLEKSRIRRTLGYNWEYESDEELWVRFSNETCNEIEKAYCGWIK